MSCRSSTKPAALLGLLVCGIGLSGCSDLYFDRRDSIAPWSGNAVAQNRIVQMIDPWPPYANKREIAYNGEVMARAVSRYRTGRVIPPCNPATSAVAAAAACSANANNAANINPPAPSAPAPAGPPPSTWAGPQKAGQP